MALIQNTYGVNSVFENAADYGSNLLTGDQTDFEGGTTGSWVGSANYTPSNTTDQAQAGTHSLKLTSAATGAKTATSTPLTVTAGTVYGGYGYIRANTTVRLLNPIIGWYSDAGATTLISFTIGSVFYLESNTAWLRVQVAGVAPATAIRAKLIFSWGNSAAGEIHYLDSVFFGTATANSETASTLKVEARGRGGTGGAGAAAARGGGGGGGAYSRVDAFSVVQGQSYTINIGAASSRDSWFSATGAAPTTTTEGVMAKGGNNGAAGSGISDGAGGAGGTAAASIGDTKFGGGAGATGAAGGGGAGDAANGSGQTGGSAGGGNGGAAGTNAGQAFGGGGGGGPILSGPGGAGGAGAVIITQDTDNDSVTASDNFSKVTSFDRTNDDSVTATDANAKTYEKPTADSVTASDDNAKATYKMFNDEVVATDDDAIISYAKPVADSVTATDDPTVTLTALRTFEETVTASDANAKEVSSAKTDSATASDASSRSSQPVKTDSVTATDEMTKVTSFARNPADSVTASDSIAKTISLKFEDSISGTSPPPVGSVIFAVLD